MRTVIIRPVGDIAGVRQKTKGKIDDAIGYLTMHGLLGDRAFSRVEITITSDCEAAALYSREGDNPQVKGFLLVAVWREAEQKYSFHS